MNDTEKGEKMKSDKHTSRVLGVAFLLQFFTSFLFSWTLLRSALIVPGNISETMIRIANHAGLMRASILVDMITAFGIVFLGAILFVTLRKQNEKIALVALGLYVMEAMLLAASKLAAFALLNISREYAATGHPAHLQTLGNLAYESMDFVGMTLHMLTFCLGAILFYYLLDKSRMVPRLFSLWGLITVFPCLIAILFSMLGHHDVPFFVYIPYVPFEFAIGVWILVKGIKDGSETR
jgi:hypothetical protein